MMLKNYTILIFHTYTNNISANQRVVMYMGESKILNYAGFLQNDPKCLGKESVINPNKRFLINPDH